MNEFSGFDFVNNACFIMDMLWVHYSGEKNVMHLNEVESFVWLKLSLVFYCLFEIVVELNTIMGCNTGQGKTWEVQIQNLENLNC